MALARRLAVALAALLGLALTVVGAWFAIILGPKGTAAFSATSDQPSARQQRGPATGRWRRGS